MKRSIIKNILLALLLTVPFLLFFSAWWFFHTWNTMTVNELIFNVKMSMSGASSEMIQLYLKEALLPTTIAFIVILLLLLFIFKAPLKGAKRIIVIIADFAVLAAALVYTWINLDMTSYIDQQLNASTFIEDNYTDPAEVDIAFPEKKKNLVYIYLESMEVTDTDTANGGAFEVSRIPELTNLALENECFNGNSGILNGGFSMPGTDWTMGAIFAQSTGLPLQISIEANSMSSQETFFPSITGLGDILEKEGYHQEFLCGSDASFGGRQLFFTEHGGFDMVDYPYAKEQGWIPEDYSAWWGFEDEKLFQFAKDRLLELSEKDEPFNLTILTADTHFEDGYLCDLCGNEFDDQYSNVYACSSRQTCEFVEWLKEQEFYQDTAVVLCGDHPTMDADFCAALPQDYDRTVYTCFLNADTTNELQEKERKFSTFDLFPTTIAALGATIDGNRLGLGTNLFSSEDTLLEKYEMDYAESELNRKSNMMNKLAGLSADAIAQQNYEDPTATVTLTEDGENINVTVTDFENVIEQIASVELEYKPDGDSSKKVTEKMKEQSDGSYFLSIPLSEVNPSDTDYAVYINSILDSRWTVFSQRGDMYLKYTDLDEYLTACKEYIDSGDYIMLISTRKSATARLTANQIELLYDLGFNEEIDQGTDETILAAIEKDNAKCIVSKNLEEMEGEIFSGFPYHLKGSWNSAKETDFLMDINGTNYMMERKGFHIAVVSKITGHVADYANFDLVDKETVR